MPVEVPIAIRQADLGPPQPETGLSTHDLELLDNKGRIRLNVLVDGELVEPRKDHDSIVFSAPLTEDDGVVTVVVTTKEGKILNVLQYDGTGAPIIDSAAGDEIELMKGFGDVIGKGREISDVTRNH
jgi:hypothetical protein